MNRPNSKAPDAKNKKIRVKNENKDTQHKIDKPYFLKDLFHDPKLEACIHHVLHNHALLVLLILGIHVEFHTNQFFQKL
jgi:hypothetical protein